MKSLLVCALLAVSPAAIAEESNAGHEFWCTADGYDHANRLRSISGDVEPTRVKAEQSALRLCRQLYMACQLRSCFQQR